MELRQRIVDVWVRLDARSKGWLGVFERTYKGFLKHQGNANAAAVAYYTLFSVFPLTLLLISLGSFVLDSEQAQQAALALVGTYLPTAADLVQRNIEGVLALRGTVTIIGVVGFLWSASGVFGGLSHAINMAWDVKLPRPAWAERALALGMVLLIALLFFLSLFSTAAFELVARLSAYIPGEPSIHPGLLMSLATRALPYIFTVLSFSFLYRVLPYTRVTWKEVLPGSLLASFAWEAAKYGFTLYLTRFASYNLVYGSVAAIIVMLLWSYVSGAIILLGAEFTAQYARKRRGE
jgi:YihY family inner membrane protein